MGKEISPVGKAMRTGLASLALAAPIFFGGCSQEPTTPQVPVDASVNSAHFPFTKNDRPIQTPKETPKLNPTPTPIEKPTINERKIFISKKPEGLFRALLTTPLQKELLPRGMISKGNSASNLDVTSQALKAIGQVNILIAEDDIGYPGAPNGGITYTIFPDATSAEDAYNLVIQHLDKSHPSILQNFVYPTTTNHTPVLGGGFNSVVVTHVNNVMLATTLNRSDKPDIVVLKKATDLMNTALAQLEKVGH